MIMKLALLLKDYPILSTQAEKEKNHKIVEEAPKKQKNVEKKRLLVRNLSPSVVLEDIIETFG